MICNRVDWRRVGVTALALLALSAGGPGCGADEGGMNEPAIAPKYSEIEAKIFPICAFSSCHGTTTPREGMSLAAGEAYENIVNKASTQVPSKMRVKPGDADGSYLFEKLSRAKPTSGDRMPPDQPLSSGTIQAVREWIQAGALRD